LNLLRARHPGVTISLKLFSQATWFATLVWLDRFFQTIPWFQHFCSIYSNKELANS
jgi:hypothetical protein